jgi:hypothetical protein
VNEIKPVTKNDKRQLAQKLCLLEEVCDFHVPPRVVNSVPQNHHLERFSRKIVFAIVSLLTIGKKVRHRLAIRHWLHISIRHDQQGDGLFRLTFINNSYTLSTACIFPLSIIHDQPWMEHSGITPAV